jgi:ribonuclease BN (tRNA processing enzyme)
VSEEWGSAAGSLTFIGTALLDAMVLSHLHGDHFDQVAVRLVDQMSPDAEEIRRH